MLAQLVCSNSRRGDKSVVARSRTNTDRDEAPEHARTRRFQISVTPRHQKRPAQPKFFWQQGKTGSVPSLLFPRPQSPPVFVRLTQPICITTKPPNTELHTAFGAIHPPAAPWHLQSTFVGTTGRSPQPATDVSTRKKVFPTPRRRRRNPTASHPNVDPHTPSVFLPPAAPTYSFGLPPPPHSRQTCLRYPPLPAPFALTSCLRASSFSRRYLVGAALICLSKSISLKVTLRWLHLRLWKEQGPFFCMHVERKKNTRTAGEGIF